MVRKIGNWLCLLFALTSSTFASVELSVADTNGNKLEQAGVGVPFVLQVIIKDQAGELDDIAGLQDAQVHGPQTSQSIRIVNGQQSSTRTYQYHVRFDTAGTYTLGPAVTRSSRGPQESQTISLVVAEQPQAHESRKMNIFMEAAADQSRVYVGQATTIRYRLYVPGTLNNVTGISPEFPSCSVVDQPLSTTGSIVKDGQHYTFVEWAFVVYPEKTGQIIIPATQMQLTTALPQRNYFDAFFGRGVQRHVVQSNAVPLYVIPLPDHEPPAQAVGYFEDFSATVDHEVAQQGEGIVYRLTLQGAGNFERIQQPRLVLPESFTSYDSQDLVTNLGDGLKQRVWEYIVQANEPGEFTLPEQQFTFFDPVRQVFTTLSARSLHVHIRPATVPPASPPHEPEQADPVLKADDQPQREPVRPIISFGTLHQSHSRQLPWSVVLLSLPFFGVLCGLFLMVRYLVVRVQQRRISTLPKRAFSLARAQVNVCKRTRDVHALYRLLIEAFAQRWQVPTSLVTPEKIEQELRRAGCDHETIQTWQVFFHDVSQAVFAHGTIADDLFERAKVWLQLFEKKL